MIHDIWFTFVFIGMFLIALLFRLLAIIIGTSNSISQEIITDMLNINVLSREQKPFKGKHK